MKRENHFSIGRSKKSNPWSGNGKVSQSEWKAPTNPRNGQTPLSRRAAAVEKPNKRIALNLPEVQPIFSLHREKAKRRDNHTQLVDAFSGCNKH